MTVGPGDTTLLTPADRQWLDRVRAATDLEDLVPLTDQDTAHDAYLAAKPRWRALRNRELGPPTPGSDLPGARVTVDDHEFHVHGITHANTTAEGDYLRTHVDAFLDAGHDVYCEQGIWSMYFSSYDAVCEMDDYRWAMEQTDALEHRRGLGESGESVDGLDERVDALASQFRDATYSLLDAGSDIYGEEYARTLGDVASSFLMRHEDHATGNDFTSFALSAHAAEHPRTLPALQRYYETAFLPQPIERDWLRRHDPALEIVTYARNERMADYAVAHHDGDPMHVITGAAHQPGIQYYLERHRDGHRSLDDFEPVE